MFRGRPTRTIGHNHHEMRLNAYLARGGIASRRKADELIEANRVTVNGLAATHGTRVEEGDLVEVDGQPVEPEPLTYVLLHKPAGVVTTASDPQGRPTVVDLVDHRHRVVPVGRLDADTTGALLLTNDGALAHVLSHPRFEIDKVYEAEVEGVPSKTALAALANGVELDDGRTAPASVHLRSQTGQTAVLELVLHEGRKRQVKRMCAAVGHPIRRLHRTGYAGLRLGDLAPGESAELTLEQIRSIKDLAEEQRRTMAGSKQRSPSAHTSPRASYQK